MKIKYKQPSETADISSGRGEQFSEFWKLFLSGFLLVIGFFITIPFLSDLIVSNISLDREQKIFRYINLLQISNKTIDEKYNAKLALTDNILSLFKGGERVPKYEYTIEMIQKSEPNAFAFPGGRIAITTGLLDQLNEEIEIAFVLGHELGHYYHRDHLKGIGRSLSTVFLFHLLLGNSPGSETFANTVTYIYQRRYSQSMEKRADQFGIELICRHYGNIRGADRLFQLLRASEKMPEWAYMFSTHPSPEERIEMLKKSSHCN